MAKYSPTKAEEVKRQRTLWHNYWKDNENTYNEYTQFVMGNQWDDKEAKVFDAYQKIPLTSNKVAPLINHLLGEQLQNTPSLQVIPDESVPVQTADIREAMVKDITFNPEAKEAFQTAFQCAAIGGYGAIRIAAEYKDNDSFEQIIRFYKCLIPTRYYWDPSAESPCKTDGMFCGYETRISRDKFKHEYGADIEKKIGFTTLSDGTVFDDDEAITLVHHYKRKIKTVKLYRLSNERTVEQDEFDRLERVMIEDREMLMDNGYPVTVIDTRKAPRYTIYYELWGGDYMLERTEFPSEQLPIVFVDQSSFYDQGGKQITRPFIKDTRDPQKYINYIATQSAYLLKIGRYDQFMVCKENVRSNDTAQAWRDPLNVKGGLMYDRSPTGEKPERLAAPELPQSFMVQYERAIMDIQQATGMYNAQLGQQGNEVSGAAVDARTKRGAYSTYKPFDSLNRSIACCGTIVNEMIPRVYDTQRVMQLNMKDRGMTPVTINNMADDYGSSVENDMREGKYTIRLVPGPSWEGQKQEALESMQMVIQANPQLFNMFADLYVENLPLANNIELRNRLRVLVPPEIIEAGKTGEPPPPKPPEPNPEMIKEQNKMQELKLKDQQLQLAQERLKMDGQKAGMDTQIKWQELQDRREEAAAALQEAELRYMSETNRTETDKSIAHANNLVSLLTHHATLQGRKHDNSSQQRR